MRFAALLLAAPILLAQSANLEKEKALGAKLASLAAEYRRQSRLPESPSVNAYLDELGQRLASAAPATGLAFTFELVDDDRTWLHEPAAFPGGPIFVPAGLILAATDKDELAGMLAHAIAHIVTRRQPRERTTGTIPLIFLGAGAGYAPPTTGNTVPIAFLPAQRQNELDSDRLAARILSTAGYNPQALVRYFDRVQPPDPTPPNVRAPYPAKDERLAALRAALENLPPADYSPHPGSTQFIRMSCASPPAPRRTLPVCQNSYIGCPTQK